MRVLVTGSRTWTDIDFIEDALDEAWEPITDPLTLVHGAAWGADAAAHHWAEGLIAVGYPIKIETHPADWSTGKGAGPRRNAEMVAAGADLCLAFIRDNSRGATHCAELARKAGIETRVYRWEEVLHAS
jgi:hypothetical protein